MDRNSQQPAEPENALAAAFFTALRFLTVIPVTWQAEKDGELFQRSIFYFPFIGLFIGCTGLLICRTAGLFVPPPVAAFGMIFYLAAISGFLHLDGLADSADGLLSARPREQSLEIMKDSRTGAMGVVILACVLLGKYAALSSMPIDVMGTAVLCMPLAGRCAIVVTMALQRYARPEGGIGGLFYSAKTRKAAMLGCIVMLSVVMFYGGTTLTAVVALMMVLTVFWFSAFCQARIGGVTGDTLGAVCELTEMSVAIGLTAVM